MIALLDKEAREDAQQRAGELGHVLADSALWSEGKAPHEEQLARYREVEDGVLDLANHLPAGTEDYEVSQLLRFLIELRGAIDADESASDPDGKVRLALAKMRDVTLRMERRIEHSALEDPQQAAAYVFDQLQSLSVTEQAELLGVSTKTANNWKRGGPVRQDQDRVRLVAKLIKYLRASMTPTGLMMWFRNPAGRLGGARPLDRLESGGPDDWNELIAFARGSRAQLAE